MAWADYMTDGIYLDDSDIYFNYNVNLPKNTPEDIRRLMKSLGNALKAGRISQFLGEMEFVEMLVKSAHAAGCINISEARTIMSIMGWDFYGTD